MLFEKHGLRAVDWACQVIPIPVVENLLEHLVLDIIASSIVFLGLQFTVPDLAIEGLILVKDLLGNAVVVVEGLRIGVGAVPTPVGHTIAYDETCQRVKGAR